VKEGREKERGERTLRGQTHLPGDVMQKQNFFTFKMTISGRFGRGGRYTWEQVGKGPSELSGTADWIGFDDDGTNQSQLNRERDSTFLARQGKSPCQGSVTGRPLSG